ncbi:hypothetical protein [Corynebacterium minutissimum]|uniref:Uncharacterized protein n=1 Tax=Corynebacterium minutissimum TaxID=38301 RepID=A0A2X4RET5_9CORY|nr:hypothetical protein [Corynebacterium minutissimum]KHO29914.1 hypothetical protein NX84_03435 [Corynebacterium minutissimum]QPS60386.1 hypothetical protein I6G51_04095 [Corynebacterium minutissimum]QQA78825.1 hypothetical protein I6H49_08760 [Corynebacterium minutissimum]SQI00766.1 Uncharacterised protein [Corynebacterium minutissimum]VEG05166.1 Uncharacterised protein [Corynebacterium minutissimum]
MTIALLHDVLWGVLPMLYLLVAFVVLGIEIKYDRDMAHIKLWTAAQLLLPGIALIAWYFLEVPKLKRLKQGG